MVVRINTRDLYGDVLLSSDDFYKPYMGKTTEQMPKLIAEQRVPLSIVGIMYGAIGYPQFDDWFASHFDSRDAVAYSSQSQGRKIKLILDCDEVSKISRNSEITEDGALKISPEFYESIKSPEFNAESLEKYKLINRLVSIEEGMQNPLLAMLARNELGVLENFLENVQEKRKKFDDGSHVTGFYLDSHSDNAKLRLVYKNRLGFGCFFGARHAINEDYGILIGASRKDA